MDSPSTESAEAGPGLNPQELRLALSMRGGVSLAVWIGGAAAEVDRLRAERAARSDHPWNRLAELAGYRAVSIDVLTGASAGGLNGAILAASLVYGFPFARMRDLWVRLADIESMARPTSVLAGGRAPSLFEGDAYFRDELARLLRENIDAAAGTPGADRIDLLLTATLVDPVPVERNDDRLAVLREQRQGAFFRFHHVGGPGDPLSDFSSREEATAAGGTADQLALAGRATSSYPFAFEPATVVSHVTPPAVAGPNLRGRFTETAPAGVTEPFRVIDGGVLDNIPVAAAIRAIAAKPANGPTERWLLYLHPAPAATDEAAPTERRLPLGAVGTTLAALFARADQESLLGDIDELEAHNREVERVGLRRRALFAPFAVLPPGERAAAVAARAAAVAPQHAQLRARLHRDDVDRLLHDPSARAIETALVPPFPRDPLGAWDPDARALLPEQLGTALAAAAEDGAAWPAADLRAATAAVELGVTWARELERWAPADRLDAIGRTKAALYRLGLVARVVGERADRCWLQQADAAPVRAPEELAGWLATALGVAQAAEHALSARTAAPLAAALDAVTPDAVDELDFHRRLCVLDGALADALGQEHAPACLAAARVGSDAPASAGADPPPTAAAAGPPDAAGTESPPSVAAAGPPASTGTESPPGVAAAGPPASSAHGAGAPVDAAAKVWRVAGQLAARLAGEAPSRPDHPAADPAANPELVAHEVLERSGDDAEATLRRLVVLTSPLAATATAGARIRFLRVAGDAAAPLPFTRLRARGTAPLSVDDKLCGTQLFDFGAFLSARWRANDWMWGRLDAAASLVALLVDTERLRLFAGPLGAAGLTAAIGAIATSVPTAELGAMTPADAEAWRTFLVARWRTHQAGVEAEMADLFTAGTSDPTLPRTRAALLERIHWAIVATEVPFVAALEDVHADGVPDQPVPAGPTALAEAVEHYAVGAETIADLGDVRVVRIAMRTGLVAFRALRPQGWALAPVVGRVLLTAGKPLGLAGLFAAVTPERGILALAVGLGALVCSGWNRPDDQSWSETWDEVALIGDTEGTQWDAVRIVLAALAVLAVVLALRIAGRAVRGGRTTVASPLAAWRPVAAAGLLTTGLVLAVAGVRLGPALVVVTAAGVGWLGTFWMRPGWRAAATLATAAVYVVLALAGAPLGLSIGWWIALAGLSAAYGMAALVSVFDVLPPRPRRRAGR